MLDYLFSAHIPISPGAPGVIIMKQMDQCRPINILEIKTKPVTTFLFFLNEFLKDYLFTVVSVTL